MTRTVADAAAMMQVLSRPDARDSMSLPCQDIAWASFDQGVEKLRGLRIGLLLDAGCGLPVEPEVLAAVQAAARRFEAAGAIVEPLPPFMTQAMLDGMDHFWRMRSRIDLAALDPADKAKVLPYIRAVGRQRGGHGRRSRVPRSQPVPCGARGQRQGLRGL